MADVLKITGMNTIIRNLTKTKVRLGRDVARGLKKGGLHLQRVSQKIVPFQIGNLHGSAYCRNIGGSGFNTDIAVGYTAKYAVFVHENLGAVHGAAFNIKYAEQIAAAAGTHRGTAEGGMINRGENQQAKFLEQPARTEKKTILRIIHREAKF